MNVPYNRYQSFKYTFSSFINSLQNIYKPFLTLFIYLIIINITNQTIEFITFIIILFIKMKNISSNININIFPEIIDKKVFKHLSTPPQNTLTLHSLEHKITAIAFLNFDTNIGQTIEAVYPQTTITGKLSHQICSIGFPETNRAQTDESQFYTFKLRTNLNTPQSLHNINIQDQPFYYCYTFFFRKKCSSIHRKYIQKSIVILSLDYNYTFYYEKLTLLYSLLWNSNDNCFSYNENIIQSFIEDSVHINTYFINTTPSIIYDNMLFDNLSMFYILKVTALWELVITNTPICVMCDTPLHCSSVVMILQSLIYPLSYIGDVRPYLSIYDVDYMEYKDNDSLIQLNSPIVGIINPLLMDSMRGFVVVRFDDEFYKTKGIEKEIDYEMYMKREKELTMLEGGFNILKANRNLFKSFFDYLKENNNDKSKLDVYLRTYLIELNNDFMRVIDEFIFEYKKNTLEEIVFLKNEYSMYEIFNENEFISHLENSQLISFNTKYIKDKRKCIELYEMFIKSKIFKSYLKYILNKIKQHNII